MSLMKYFEATTKRENPRSVLVASVEDLDPGAVQMSPPIAIVSPTPDVAADVSRTYAELEASQKAKMDDQVRDVSSGLSDVANAVDTANEVAGGISTESAYFLNVATESLYSRLGWNSKAVTEGMEHIDHEVPRVVNSEVYHRTSTALESVSDEGLGLEGVDKPGKETFKRFSASIIRAANPVWGRAKLQGKLISGIVDKAKGVSPKSGAKIRVKSSTIAYGDGPSKQLSRDIRESAEFLKYLTGEFSYKAIDDYAHNGQAIDKHLADWDAESDDAAAAVAFEKAAKALLADWHDPRKSIRRDPSAPIVGNMVLFTNHSLKYKGDGEVFKKFDALANHNYPTIMAFSRKKNAASRDGSYVEVPALSPKEIVEIGELLENTIRSISAIDTLVERTKSGMTVGSFVGASATFSAGITIPFAAFMTIYLTKVLRRTDQLNSTPGKGWLKNGMRAIYDALVTSGRLRFHVHHDAISALIDLSKVFRKVAALSLAAHSHSSNEMYDEESVTAGVTVNERDANEPEMVPDKASSVALPSKPVSDSNINKEPWTVQEVEPDDGIELSDVGTESVEGRQPIPYYMLTAK